jgi:predicted ATPase
MIKNMYIDNFKAFNDFNIDFKPLTVLIGGNGSGKSTVLQVIDLLCNIVKVDIDSYIYSRGWEPSDLKSQLSSSSKRQITLRTTFELNIKDEQELLVWEVVFNSNKTENKLFFIAEKVYSKKNNNIFLRYSSRNIERFNKQEQKNELLPNIDLTASFMKNIDIEKDKDKYPELCEIKRFLTQSDSFELLSTEKIRKRSSRGKTNDIGLGGEKLASFIHGLNAEQKLELKNRLKKYVPFIENVDTIAKGKPGWLEMSIYENFNSNFTKVKSIYQSDGILRIIAIASIAEIEKGLGVVLLDEIEDGINPYLASSLVNDLKEISNNEKRQIIVTTHSTVILDYFEADSIVFIWRNEKGKAYSKPLFLNKQMKERLEYMYPGEIWLNMSEQEIIESLEDEEE